MSRAAEAAPPTPDDPRSSDLILDGTVAMYNRGFDAGLPILRRALADFGARMSTEDQLHWMWLGSGR